MATDCNSDLRLIVLHTIVPPTWKLYFRVRQATTTECGNSRHCCLRLMVAGAILLSVGCGSARQNVTATWNLASYKNAIRTGVGMIPEATDMQSAFPETDHMIIAYGKPDDQEAEFEWQTVSFFGGRYELTMVIKISLSQDGNRVTQIAGEPIFYFHVIKKLDQALGASYHGNRQVEFGRKKWAVFKQSQFDPAVLDPEFDGTIVARFDEYVQRVRQPRMVWRDGNQ
jgi:hypothetical protein